MGLLTTNPLRVKELKEPLISSYFRVDKQMDVDGKVMTIRVWAYETKEQFDAAKSNYLELPFDNKFVVNYDRFSNSYDELDFAHIEAKKFLMVKHPDWDETKLEIVGIFPIVE